MQQQFLSFTFEQFWVSLCMPRYFHLKKPSSLYSNLVTMPDDLLTAKVLRQLGQFVPNLVTDLILRRLQDLLKHWQQFVGQTLDDRVLSLVEADDHLEDRLVLAEVFL